MASSNGHIYKNPFIFIHQLLLKCIQSGTWCAYYLIAYIMLKVSSQWAHIFHFIFLQVFFPLTLQKKPQCGLAKLPLYRQRLYNLRQSAKLLLCWPYIRSESFYLRLCLVATAIVDWVSTGPVQACQPSRVGQLYTWLSGHPCIFCR